jgi:hypothetical protein
VRLFVNASFYVTKSVTLWRSQIWPIVMILWFVKSGHNDGGGIKELQKSGFSWLFLRLFVTFFKLFVCFFTFWDDQFLDCKNHHIVTVTIVTICDSVLWRLKADNAAGFRKLQNSGFSSFWDFLWLPAFMLQNVTILWLAKTGHNEAGYRKLQKSFFSWLFCDNLWPCLFLCFASVLNKHTYRGCCRTNNYQKHFCFTSLH